MDNEEAEDEAELVDPEWIEDSARSLPTCVFRGELLESWVPTLIPRMGLKLLLPRDRSAEQSEFAGPPFVLDWSMETEAECSLSLQYLEDARGYGSYSVYNEGGERVEEHRCATRTDGHAAEITWFRYEFAVGTAYCATLNSVPGLGRYLGAGVVATNPEARARALASLATAQVGNPA